MELDPVAALLAFAPVPLRARRDGWTPARQRRFVLALALTGNWSRAARMVGLSVQSAMRLRGRPGAEDFDAACALAAQAGRRRRVLAGIERDRARRRAARKLCAEVSQRPAVFSPRGSEPSAPSETSAPARQVAPRPAAPPGRQAPPPADLHSAPPAPI